MYFLTSCVIRGQNYLVERWFATVFQPRWPPSAFDSLDEPIPLWVHLMMVSCSFWSATTSRSFPLFLNINLFPFRKYVWRAWKINLFLAFRSLKVGRVPSSRNFHVCSILRVHSSEGMAALIVTFHHFLPSENFCVWIACVSKSSKESSSKGIYSESLVSFRSLEEVDFVEDIGTPAFCSIESLHTN